MALIDKIKDGELRNISIVITVLIAVVVILEISGHLAPSLSGSHTLTSSNPCVAESNFTCSGMAYGSSKLTFLFSQKTGATYYGDWVFVASGNQSAGPANAPSGFSVQNSTELGTLASGQVAEVSFTAFKAGGIPTNPTTGTVFSGYVWLGYCTSLCNYPTYFVRAASVQLASTAGITS
jgi:hypothetical protein